jgi:hypothetical protein
MKMHRYAGRDLGHAPVREWRPSLDAREHRCGVQAVEKRWEILPPLKVEMGSEEARIAA